MRRAGRLWRGLSCGVSVVTAASLCAACGGGGRSASTTVSQFLAAWDRGDGTTMSSLVYRPPAGFGPSVAALTAGLHATSVQRVAGPVTAHGSRATATVTATYNLPGVGPWKEDTQIALGRHSGNWQVEWSPAVVATGLQPGQRLIFSASWAPRADILGAGGTPLTVAQPRVVVGVEGSRVKDAAGLSKLLIASGAPASAVSSALAAAAAHPTFFEQVFELSMEQYQALGGNSGALHQAAGTVFQHVSARGAVTAGLAAHLVGSVGPITADQLKHLGSPYTASSSVGQNGLEAYYEKQLAGTPGGKVEIVGSGGASSAGASSAGAGASSAGAGASSAASSSAGASGAGASSAGAGAGATLATFNPVAGRPVSTSIDPVVQRAAEQAMSSVVGTAGMVAIRVSTGELLASVSLPAGGAFDPALAGTFPPGSTFKILTSTALFQAGLSPSSPASCPPTATVDGETFHNAEGDQPVSSLSQAFTESCNTAFVQLASSHLSASSFTSVAGIYGLGDPIQMGYPAFAGKVPAPSDGAALSATAIGQAGVVASPLNMAAVAADVARGSVRPPRLVSGAPADSAPTKPLDPTVVAGLRSMMASVVASGTAAGTGLPAGTYAKTGTAEYGSGNPLPTDAWLVGWHGDVAFAMVVQNSKGNGGPVDGPVIARFLAGLPAS